MEAGTIHVRFALLDDLNQSVCAARPNWLHPAERDEVSRLKEPRRHQWLCGRWLCKRLIQDAMPDVSPQFTALRIQSRDPTGRGTRPRVALADHFQTWSLSIAHSDRAVVAALDLSGRRTVGVDLVEQQDLGSGFQQIWFTDTERSWLHPKQSRERLVVWAFKESVYKAMNRGEGFAPRRIEIRPVAPNEYSGSYRDVPLDGRCRLHVLDHEGGAAALAVASEAAGQETRIQLHENNLNHSWVV